MKKSCNIITIIIFVSFLFAVPITTKIQKNESFLFYENRMANSILKLNKENFLNGTFFKSIEKYFVDIFPFRENILRFHTKIDRDILKKPIVKDIVFADNLLLPNMGYTTKDDFDELNRAAIGMVGRLSRLNNIIEKNNGKFYYVGIPEQYSYFRNKYPKYIFNNEKHLENIEKAFFDELKKNDISYINMYDEYSSINFPENLYSKVDHHFNFYGAVKAYQCIIEKINSDCRYNLNILTENDINFIEPENVYMGSRNKKVMGLYMTEEKAIIGYPKEKIPFRRIDNNNNIKVDVSNMFVVPQDKNQYITYLVYMGGDMGETIITTNRDYLPNILIFGDSFTNPIESIIYTSFNETRSIDLRHYNEKSIKEYIKEYKPDIVLCIRADVDYLNKDGNGDI